MARRYSSESSDGDAGDGKDKDYSDVGRNSARLSCRRDSGSPDSEMETRMRKRDRREDRSSRDKGREREKGERRDRRRRGTDDEDDGVEDRRRNSRNRHTKDDVEDRRMNRNRWRKNSDNEQDNLEERGRNKGDRRRKDSDDEEDYVEERRRNRGARQRKDSDEEEDTLEDRRRNRGDRRRKDFDDEEDSAEDRSRDKKGGERYRIRSDSEDDKVEVWKRDRIGRDGGDGRVNNERQQEMGADDGVKKFLGRSGDDHEQMRRDRKDRLRSHRREDGHEQRDYEEACRDRERWSQRFEEYEDEALKKSERWSRRFKEDDDDDDRETKKSDRRSQRVEEDKDERDPRKKSEKDRRKDNGEHNERYADGGSQRVETGDDRSLKGSKPGRQSTLQENSASTEVSSLGRSGGVYIPPFKLARMMKEVQDKSSIEYQRLTWDALRKSINGLVNKVNATNIKNIVLELFSEDLIRGRGLFCRSCMKSQMASPGFTDVFAALVAVVNTKFPEVGELLLRRIVLQLKRAYKRNDKPQLLAAVKFIAHLVNQQVAHEIIALELLTVLLENPTDDSVEVAVGFVKECGSILQDLSPKGLHGIFERFRGILHEGEIDKRVQFLIEGLFAIRKAKFQGHPAVRPELDLVEQEDQLTHEISLQEDINPEIALDIFKPDPDFLENEKRYEELKKTILGEESEDEEGSEVGSEDESDEESDEEDEEQMKIKDETETNLVNLRRTIYLTIMSSVDFEEAGHKLLKIKLEPGQEMELCIMLLECCSQERTYLRYYGLLGQRFCMINKVHQENFEKCFVQQYSMIHRLETNKLRNVAKFFAHLLGTDALPWHVLSYIRLTEDDTTSSSRIFIKILFQELSEHLGIRLLNERLNDPSMVESFESIFPKDNPKNTRFAINFFTSIGLGGITENLREYLKNMPRLIMQQQAAAASELESESDDSASSSSSDSESEPDSNSGLSSSESERERRNSKRRRRN